MSALIHPHRDFRGQRTGFTLEFEARFTSVLRRLLASSALSLFAVGCGGEEHPPFAADGVSARGDGRKSDEPIEDPTSGQQIIAGDEAAETGSCGLVDVEHEVLRPNFYFLLDASDSMENAMPDSGGVTRHTAARRAVLDMLRATGYRVNFGAAIFPDPNATNGCTAGREVFTLRPGEPQLEDGSDNRQLQGLSFTLSKYAPSGATPVAATLRALSDQLMAYETPTALFLLTDGAPNCDEGNDLCDIERCILNIEQAEVEDLVCDADLNCCNQLAPHLCLDDDDTIAAISDLAGAGVRTYVIGIPGSEIYADVLDAMARAAGTERDDAETEYYRVDDAEDLAVTLTALGQELSASCEFDLGSEPKHVDLVRVLLDDEALILDDPDGFRWTSERSIEIGGRACNRWRKGRVFSVRVLEECVGEAR